mgnify:CR=1 FL=1
MNFDLSQVHPFFASLIISGDAYKYSQYMQKPVDLRRLWSAGGPRSLKRFKWNANCGLQDFSLRYLMRPFTQEELDLSEDILKSMYCPFDREGFRMILDEHGGYFPIELWGVPEGTITPANVMTYAVSSTDERLPGLGQFVETALLRPNWFTPGVSTVSWHIKQDVIKWLDLTSDNKDAVLQIMLNDFGSRGSDTFEGSACAGLGHLPHFRGTDNVSSVALARSSYGQKTDIGVSIYAMEHSTVQSFGREGEVDAIRCALNSGYKIVAFPIDTYDSFNCINNLVCGELKDEILAFGAQGGKLVCRNDSGDAKEMIPFVLKALANGYNFTTNSKGKDVLNPCVGTIQSDGVDYVHEDTVNPLYQAVSDAGFSVESVPLGMGAGLTNAIKRDTMSVAQKVGWGHYRDVDRHEYTRDLVKECATQPEKRSKPGIRDVIMHEDGLCEEVQVAASRWVGSAKKSIMERKYTKELGCEPRVHNLVELNELRDRFDQHTNLLKANGLI